MPDAATVPAAALKAELRKTALERRGSLSVVAREAASRAAITHVVPLLGSGQRVALFWPMRGEIDPLGLAPEIRRLGGQVLLPAVVGRDLAFRLYPQDGPLEPGAFGTRHPPPSQAAADPDLIVAPLAAFDRRGGRIGYGGGFYDRALARLRHGGRQVPFIGIAFACQEVDRVPVEGHDEPLAAIATENELIRVESEA
ncbi:5-formyltetrahydrofolate cyclo-ligase [Faunimonas pinastri]|uniref:5-formyltetrahydrofolate cyclo-ligase n=1 Tax=Faunimonas pinastri TaxID=1855383 RepID=A0A1H8Z8Q2_9HYPH|nr:5-formyltetrahydrofolate cyclo-ligase [Faunimonas pinastri]SEP59998.1 5-formyltetrahydrofolate cyclo-ligase [Faunimonas pinastri]